MLGYTDSVDPADMAAIGEQQYCTALFGGDFLFVEQFSEGLGNAA